MSKRILLSTVFFAVPLALAGCSNYEGQVSGGMESTEFLAASGGSHELGVIIARDRKPANKQIATRRFEIESQTGVQCRRSPCSTPPNMPPTPLSVRCS